MAATRYLGARHERHEVESECVRPDYAVVLTPPPVDHLGHVEAQYEAQGYEVSGSAQVDAQVLKG